MKWIYWVLIFSAILVAITLSFKNSLVTQAGSLLLLMVYFLFLDGSNSGEKKKILIPLIITFFAVISPIIISLTYEPTTAKVYFIRYEMCNEDFHITPDLWNFYYLTFEGNAIILRMKALQTENLNENVFWGGAVGEQLKCGQECNLYFMDVHSEKNNIEDLRIYGSVFTNNLQFIDAHPKIKVLDNKGSYGRGGFGLELKDLSEGEHASISLRSDDLYNFTFSCIFEKDSKNHCEVSIYDVYIHGVPPEATALNLLDERDGKIKNIILPQDNETELFKLNFNTMLLEPSEAEIFIQ